MIVESVRQKAFLDISIGGKAVGRVVVELFDDIAPKASQNFINLCTNKTEPTFEHTYFHRVIKNFVIQGGDIINGKADNGTYPHDNLGTSNISTLGESIEGENLSAPIDGPFILCSANDGDANNNGSQFFITTYPQPHLSGKHSVFGKVIHGKSVVREIERVSTDDKNVPLKNEITVIESCGIWEDGDDIPIFNACYDNIGGDIYEEHPDDDETIDKESSESAFNAASIIKESGTLLFKKGEKEKALLKYIKSLRYVMIFIPDEEQEPEWYNKYNELKKKLYLNLSLVYLQLKNYPKAVDYSSFLIEMKNLTEPELAKAYYRKGTGLLGEKKYEEAVGSLKKAKEILPDDVAINQEIDKVEKLMEQKKAKAKANYAKFFS